MKLAALRKIKTKIYLQYVTIIQKYVLKKLFCTK